MHKSYFKTTLRYLARHRLFAVINCVGIATAFCVVFFSWLYIDFEKSYDAFNTNKERIFRVSTDVATETGITKETSAAPLAETMLKNLPEVEEVTRIFLDYYIVQHEGDPPAEATIAYADSTVFSMFAIHLIAGTSTGVFNAPFNMVVSESYAKRFFGTTDCIGKVLKLDGTTVTTVTGVMQDIPRNAHLHTDLFLSMSSLIKPGSSWMANWSRFGFSTYVLLKPFTNADKLNAGLTAIATAHKLKTNKPYQLVSEPLSTLYLRGSFRGNKAGATAYGNYKNIYIFSAVALFVMLIACFNFVNLSTALSLKRSKEIGVRKVAGASRQQLIIQFLMDSVVISTISFLVAIVLCILLAPAFNLLAGKTIIAGFSGYGYQLTIFFLLSLCTGFAAGLYPAFFLSGYQPLSTLKGKFSGIGKGLQVRQSLVVTQFCLSIILIAATIVVHRQVAFMRNENLGFDKTQKLVIDYHYDPAITEHAAAVKARALAIPGILDVSLSSCIPGRPNKTFPTTVQNLDSKPVELQCDAWFTDQNFLDQYKIAIVAGRNFSPDSPGDITESMLLNETAVKKLGYKNLNDVIGKQFIQHGTSGVVIGVVKDFHYHSLHEEIAPLTLQVSPGFFTFLTLSINGNHTAATISELEKTWRQIAPQMPLIYFFGDETYNAQYAGEERFGKLFITLATIAIIISCLGLLGLAAFNTTQKQKEIGVRKVLGASVTQIVALLTTDLLKLIVLAFLIAVPVSYFMMMAWLQDFAYRVSLSWWIFLSAGIAAFLISFFTISFQSIKAAVANPVKSLRTE